jgi:hypothetical protein
MACVDLLDIAKDRHVVNMRRSDKLRQCADLPLVIIARITAKSK